MPSFEWPPVPEPLPGEVVDNHTHLPVGVAEDAGLREGSTPLTVAEQVRRARDAGVTRLIQVGCDLDTLEGSIRLAQEHPEIVAAIAIHPNEAPLHAGIREVGPDGLEPAMRDRHRVPLAQAVAEVAELARHERVRAIGETGLDFFRTGEVGRIVQREAFRDHIDVAKELGLPLQIHDRDAHAEVVEVLLSDGAPERTVFHCFSGDVELARICAEQGWYASFAGPVTFASNDALREALRAMPRDLVLVETDAPYLTPKPFRGRPNGSYVMPVTVRAIAEQWQTDLALACERLRENTDTVYGTW